MQFEFLAICAYFSYKIFSYTEYPLQILAQQSNYLDWRTWICISFLFVFLCFAAEVVMWYDLDNGQIGYRVCFCMSICQENILRYSQNFVHGQQDELSISKQWDLKLKKLENMSCHNYVMEICGIPCHNDVIVQCNCPWVPTVLKHVSQITCAAFASSQCSAFYAPAG